ncbi:hypothetical protein BDK51DRAFT_39852, partial [Blyttiomyces helicus]
MRAGRVDDVNEGKRQTGRSGGVERRVPVPELNFIAECPSNRLRTAERETNVTEAPQGQAPAIDRPELLVIDQQDMKNPVEERERKLLVDGRVLEDLERAGNAVGGKRRGWGPRILQKACVMGDGRAGEEGGGTRTERDNAGSLGEYRIEIVLAASQREESLPSPDSVRKQLLLGPARRCATGRQLFDLREFQDGRGAEHSRPRLAAPVSNVGARLDWFPRWTFAVPDLTSDKVPPSTCPVALYALFRIKFRLNIFATSTFGRPLSSCLLLPNVLAVGQPSTTANKGQEAMGARSSPEPTTRRTLAARRSRPFPLLFLLLLPIATHANGNPATCSVPFKSVEVGFEVLAGLDIPLDKSFGLQDSVNPVPSGFMNDICGCAAACSIREGQRADGDASAGCDFWVWDAKAGVCHTRKIADDSDTT